MKWLLTITTFLSVFFCFSQTDEIDRLTIELAYQKQDTTKVITSLQLIKSLVETENFKKAILYLEQTDQLAQSLNYDKGLADTNFFRGLIYAREDDYVNALDSFNKSRLLFQQLYDHIGVAKVNNNVGLLEINRGNYAVGLRNSMSAIDAFERENLQTELSLAYGNLAEAYFKTKQLESALEYSFKSLNAKENISDTLGIKTTTKNIGIIYSLENQHTKAIEYFEKVLAMLGPDDNSIRTEILPRIGDEYLALNKTAVAGNYLVEGLNLSREIGDDEGIIRALNAMGNLNLKEGRVRLANNQLNEAYEIAKNSKHKPELLKNLKLRKELDSTRNYYQSAFFWQGKYYNLKEEIARENAVNTSKIINLDSAKLEPTNEAEETTEENRNTNSSSLSEKSKYIIYALAAGLLFSIAAFVFLFVQRKKDEQSRIDSINEKRELKLQNDAYYEQMQNLEETNNVKDRLFSIVSHDLKDSVSSIKGFIDLLKEDSLTREEFYDLVPELSENANNASLLLFNLLNWSKSQMQSLESHPELFNIQDIFKGKLQLIEQKAEEKRIVVIDESHRDFVYADKSMIEIVIQNLITNAVKFSRVGDIITVTNKDLQGKSLITIEDTGIGIAEENLDKLFQKNNFTTIGTKNEKGTGLGLVICKELVELNNGRIWVESSRNVGTKFFIELPKSKPTAS
ncbi:Signal transduction histidine kinase [Flavobacteriaceae bacterium MAR_2010_188]|nr:Signal transduction histidine kinase [Flavobacteriaceae bacterium MAR_2010_188]